MRTLQVWCSGWIVLGLAGALWADMAVLSPSGQNLAPGQFGFEFENQSADEGDLRYYMLRYGLKENLEVSTITLDEDFGAGSERNTMINLQYQYAPETPYVGGLALGIWDLQDQDDEGLGRSYYLVTERTLERPMGQLVEHFGYSWSGHPLNGFFGGAVLRSPEGYDVALEHSPVTGFNVQARYHLSEQFQLRAGSFDGDLTFGLMFQTQPKSGGYDSPWWK